MCWNKKSAKPIKCLIGERDDELLTPCLLNENDASYESVIALQYAMSKPESKNIAVTGGYGSGKSSVINTYLQKSSIAEDKILRISLSNFADKTDSTSEGGELDYENMIEELLFKQVFHKSNAIKTCRTKQRRLLHIPIQYVCGITALLMILLFCILLLCNKVHIVFPDSVLSLYREHISAECQFLQRIILDIVAMLYIVVCVFLLVGIIIKRGRRFNIASLKTDNVQIDLEKDGTYLCRNLDEILYFLRAGEYEVVVWEDLDRIAHSEKLFLKLREINVLLNEAKTICRRYKPIRFIYAIRDDIFTGEIRTKFFDYIVPVIPVVDTYNAGDYLIKKYGTVLEGVEKQDIAVLGMYIRGKRELTNIMNEYITYKRSLEIENGESKKKLLALLIYKNLFPKDYAEIYERKGFLYALFCDNNKHIFYDKLLSEVNSRISHSFDVLRKLEEDNVKVRQEVVGYIIQYYNVTKLIIGGKAYPIEDFETNEFLFERLRKNEVDKYCYDTGDEAGECAYNLVFEDIKSAIDPDNTIDERLWNNNEQQQEEKERLQTLQKEVIRKRGLRLRSLLKENEPREAKRLIENVCKSAVKGEKMWSDEMQRQVEILQVLISAGYIEEDYPTYMSHSYDGILTEKDFVFINSVMRYEALDSDYKLDNTPAVYLRLSTENYRDRSILNASLLNYLIDNKKDTCAMLDLFVRTARENPKFVIDYSNIIDARLQFFDDLFSDWEEPINNLMNIKEEDARNNMLLLFFRTAPQNIRLANNEKRLIGSMYDFMTKNISFLNVPKLISFIAEQHIIFDSIKAKTDETTQLFDYVISYKMFVINYENLRAIYGEIFDKQSFTVILSGDHEVCKYACKDMSKLLDTFPESDTDENFVAIQTIVNDTSIDEDRLTKYLHRQTQKISPDGVKNDRILLLYELGIISPTWENVQKYFQTQDQDDDMIIIEFIRKNKNQLAAESCLVDDSGALQRFLLADNTTLNIDDYRLFVNSFSRTMTISELPDNLSDDRMSILIGKGLIGYSAAFVTRLREHPVDVFVQYLVKYFENFMDDNLDIDWTNAIEIALLNSSLPLAQKVEFMNNSVVIVGTEDDKELAQLVCFYYNLSDDMEGADLSLIEKALFLYQEEGAWETKISLINKVHACCPYNKERTTKFINALGGGYVELNLLGGHTSWFDDNVPNIELLTYLKKNAHCVSSFRVVDGRLKVAYRRK